MKIEKKLLFYIFLIPIIGMIIGMSGGIYLINYSNNLSQNEGAKFLEKRELKLQKDKIKITVNSVITNLKSLNITENNLVKKMKELYPAKKDSYIFIYKVLNLNGGKKFAEMLLDINRPDLEGKKIDDNYKDVKGFQFRKKILQLVREKGEGFVTYYYKKPNSNKIIQKISYFKYYKPSHLIVASGVYLDDIGEIVKHYKEHLDSFNVNIMEKFFLISSLIFGLTLFFTTLISKNLVKEFHKFRKTISLNEKKLRYKLYIDELTKLKSRKALVEDIEKNKFSCLILIDIDNFSNINQLFGSEFGDKYLQEFAYLLKLFRKTIKNSLIIYRVGADEFAIGVKNSDYDNTYLISEHILYFLHQQKIHIDNEEFDVDATIVFSDFPTPLRRTLMTLTEAKNLNKPILSYRAIKNKNKEQEFFEIKKMLKTAIEKDQITPYAQSIVDKNEKVIKYELLMRIVTPEKVIPPYFLEYAKKVKLYTKISSMMINKCFKFIRSTNILCSINIDMQDITNPEILIQLKNNLKNLNKPVVFEILESESFQNYNELKKFITEFKEYGVLFAIDDFGSGYSNYSEILELKPDYLKLDGSLIKNISKSNENLILVESILFLTNIIGIKTTAEFVETKEIFDKLNILGIDEFQGYYFYKPTPLNEL